MSLLDLWHVSLAMAGLSLVIMVGMILARLWSERRTRRLAARRASLLPRLLAGDVEQSELLSGPIDPLTTDLVVELVAMVRGDERDGFVALGSRLGAEDALAARLARGKPRTKVVAAEALAHFSGQRATDALDRALDDDSADVRLAAALALSQSGRAPPIALLVERLSLGRAENSLLLVSLLQHLVEDRREEVEALLEDDGVPPAVKAAAIDALAAFGSFAIAPTITRLAIEADPHGEEVARYLRALGTLRHPAGIPAIEHHLDAPTGWARAAAAEAAGRIGVDKVAPQLAALLEDEDWWVRFRAGEALSRLGEDGIARLHAAADADAPRTHHAARMTLAELGIAHDGR